MMAAPAMYSAGSRGITPGAVWTMRIRPRAAQTKKSRHRKNVEDRRGGDGVIEQIAVKVGVNSGHTIMGAPGNTRNADQKHCIARAHPGTSILRYNTPARRKNRPSCAIAWHGAAACQRQCIHRTECGHHDENAHGHAAKAWQSRVHGQGGDAILRCGLDCIEAAALQDRRGCRAGRGE